MSTIEVKFLGKVSAGTFKTLEKPKNKTIRIDSKSLKGLNPDMLFAAEVDGDSVKHKKIESGDIVLLEQVNNIKENDLVVLESKDNNFIIKEFIKETPQKIKLIGRGTSKNILISKSDIINKYKYINKVNFKIENYKNKFWLDEIFRISKDYLDKSFSSIENEFLFNRANKLLKKSNSRSDFIRDFTNEYIKIVKNKHQKKYTRGSNLLKKELESKNNLNVIWGDCKKVLEGMDSESVDLMVTSPPYYNAREYSNWDNLNAYLQDMAEVIKESYRVLDNHKVFVLNVGDIFGNDNLTQKSQWSDGAKKIEGTRSTWGKRRIPLGAHFIKIFEEAGFTFVDDFIWDKGEVQSERHKNGNKPYPFYQYPANCYEHILVFHKHRPDDTRFPCPICGTLKVNGNSYSEIGLRSWECKNKLCPERSKSNRGKRFSLKTLYTQSKRNKEDQIDNEFIKKWRRDVIRFGPVIKINSKGKNTLGHTAPFPEIIPEFAIRMFSYVGDVVVDPFAGSCTSIISASKLKRVGIGIEKNKKMFRNSIMRNINKNIPNINIKEIDFL